LKKKILIGVVLLLVSSLMLSGCAGVSQEEYDAVVAERDTAQAQVASLQSDYAALQANAALAATYVEFIPSHIGAAYSGVEKDAEYWAEFEAGVEALNDPELSAMFAEMGALYMSLMAQGLSEEEMMQTSEYAQLMQLHDEGCEYIISKITELLGVEQ
jgi:outer membrane murein-binding lipoprotein Lpp